MSVKTIMHVYFLSQSGGKIKAVNLIDESGPHYPECEWDYSGPEEFIECCREDLWFWIEREIQHSQKARDLWGEDSYTEKLCLSCAVKEGLLTEDEIKAFSPVCWKHYQEEGEIQYGLMT